jgi:hypothetical protein
MSGWTKKEIGYGEDAYRARILIGIEFDRLVERTGANAEISVFATNDDGIITLYFTPKARYLADKLDAVKCEKPPRKGLGLDFGHKIESWRLFFPEP